MYEMIFQKHEIDLVKVLALDEAPHINLDCPYIKKQVSDLSAILAIPKVLENVRLLLDKNK
jgi:hypothetical protein